MYQEPILNWNDDFSLLDEYLLSQKDKIIHQIWFRLSWKSKKLLKKFNKYQSSWMLNNPDWQYVLWDENMALQFMKNIFPEYVELYKKYKYSIQRIDVLRYFILYRYGGLYADMDLECITSMNEIRDKYPDELYLVETGNKAMGTHVSNLLMFSVRNHPFWSTLFLELYKSRELPWFYTKHLEIMFSTGPAFLNRVYSRYMYKYSISVFPCNEFNPIYLGVDKLSIDKTKLHTIHYGEGSWESADSKFLIFFYCHWKILSIVIFTLLLPILINKKTTQ